MFMLDLTYFLLNTILKKNELQVGFYSNTFSDAPYLVWGVSIYQDVCVSMLLFWTNDFLSKPFKCLLLASHSLVLASSKHI